MPSNSIKGHAFEYFVRELLLACGFTKVLPDDKIIYKNSTGTMIHGLGQPHNADVLVSPPIQIPFYFPTRLLIECKCYSDTLGLTFARNVLGLREDINGFEIVTQDILDKRKNYRRQIATLHSFERYLYQVALASISGFKLTAIEYAITHRIPLISFTDSEIFASIRDFLNNADNIYGQLSEEEKRRVRDKCKAVSDEEYIQYVEYYIDETPIGRFNSFFANVKDIADNICLGVLENGTILFLYKTENNRPENDRRYNDGFELHYTNEKRSNWYILTNEYKYEFELPLPLMQEWKMKTDELEDEFLAKKQTLEFKNQRFPKILLYETYIDEYSYTLETKIEVLNISKQFLSNAVNNENNE